MWALAFRVRIALVLIEASFPLVGIYMIFINLSRCQIDAYNMVIYMGITVCDLGFMILNLFFLRKLVTPPLRSGSDDSWAILAVCLRWLLHAIGSSAQLMRLAPRSCAISTRNLSWFGLSQIPRAVIVLVVVLYRRVRGGYQPEFGLGIDDREFGVKYPHVCCAA